MVVQQDVEKAFGHFDHRALFQAMRLQGLSPFSVALIATIRPQSAVQSNEVARVEPFLGGADCDNLGFDQHDGQARKRELKPGENETRHYLKGRQNVQ